MKLGRSAPPQYPQSKVCNLWAADNFFQAIGLPIIPLIPIIRLGISLIRLGINLIRLGISLIRVEIGLITEPYYRIIGIIGC